MGIGRSTPCKAYICGHDRIQTTRIFLKSLTSKWLFHRISPAPRQTSLGQSIVPIVAHSHGDLEMRCLRTGFFVSCSGLLITAAHVIADPITSRKGGTKPLDHRNWQLQNSDLGVMVRLPSLPPESRYIFRPIEWAAFLGQPTHREPIADCRL